MGLPPGKAKSRQVLAVNWHLESKREHDPLRVSKIRVFLIIENRLLRDMVAHLLRRRGDFELSGNCGSSETSPEEVAKSSCDVALLDFFNPEWLSILGKPSRETGLKIETVVIGMDGESAPFLEAVRSGVSGYLLNDSTAADVLEALRASVRGESVCPPRLCRILFEEVAQTKRGKGTKKMGSQTSKTGLTLRQQTLMNLVAKGLTNKEIADELHLSEFTVKNHMCRILKQLDVVNRSEAVEVVREAVLTN